MKPLYNQWVDTLANAGIKPISDDTCCRLLAIIYVFAGDKEIFTHHCNLRADIEYAKRRMNIGGGLVPDAGMSAAFRKYAEELEPQRCHGERVKTEWAQNIMSKYGIKL